MADDVIGSPGAFLSVASDATARAQAQNNLQAQQSQQVSNNALAPQQTQGVERGKAQGVQQGDMMTITKPLAKGAAQMTGDDSWLRTEGTRMDSRIYSSLLTLGAKKAYHQEILDDENKRKQMDIDAKEQAAAKKAEEAEKLEDKKAEERTARDAARHGSKMGEIDEGGKFKGKGGSGTSGGMDPKDKEFLKTYRSYANDLKGMNGTLLTQMAKTQPQAAKEMQDKALFMQKNKSRFDQLQGLGGESQPSPQDQAAKNAKAIDWLKKKYPKLQSPTEHDVEWALTQIGNND